MISEIIKTTIMSIGIGFLVQVFQQYLNTNYLNTFLYENLITILIALLAINATTLGIVLTKIRDLVEKHGNADCFNTTKKQMLLSIQEQIVLIVLAVVFLIVANSKNIDPNQELTILFNAFIVAIFSYSLFILYDTAKSVFEIINFDLNS